MRNFFLIFTIFFIEILSSFAQQNNNDSLKLLIKQDVHDTIKLKQMMDIAWNSFRTYPEQSLEIIINAHSLAKKLDLYIDEAKCENIIGIIYSTTGQYDSAYFYYSKSIAIGLKHNDNVIISKGYNNIGLNYYYQGIYDKAQENYFKTLPLYEKTSDSLGLANTYANIGNTYILMNSLSDAMNYLKNALIIYEKINNKRGIANTLNSIGSIYSETDSLGYRAKECYQRSLVIKEQLNDLFGISNTLNQLAMLYGQEKNYEKELELYQKALKIKKEIDDKSGTTKALLNIGKTYNSLKKYNDALNYYFDALKISQEIGNYYDKQQAFSAIANTYSKIKNFEKAYEFKQLYSIISDSIMNVEKSKQIIEMQTKYETEKKQKENEILAQENQIKNLEISYQKNQRTVIFIVFAFILFGGFLIFNRIRLKQENKILTEKKLRASSVFQAQEKEKVYLSKELHDGLGPLLSLIKLNASSLDVNDKNEKMIHEIKELASEGMKEVRNISHALMPSLLEKKGLESALNEFIEQINQTDSIKAELSVSLTSKQSQEFELNIYRIIQETINNILKHAEATIAIIKLLETTKQLELTVSDNGKGFKVDDVSAGNGLNNIYSRVDFLKGNLKMSSDMKTGTTFIIIVPINNI